MADRPTSQVSAEDQDFRVEIGFQELEIVAFIGQLRIVGRAHFGISGRASSQRPSDYLRHFADTRLTLSKVRIYRLASNEVVDTTPFVILNLDRVDLVYARDLTDEAGEAPATDTKAPGKK